MNDTISVRKNWLITDKGNCVNLDFLSKIVHGKELLPTPKPNAIIFYHGIAAGKGATIQYVYGSNAIADASYAQIMKTLKELGLATDLRPIIPTAVSISVITGPAAGGTISVLTGTNLQPTGTITVGGVPATSLVFDDDQHMHFTTGPHAAGAVDVVYTGPDGQTATLTASFTYV